MADRGTGARHARNGWDGWDGRTGDEAVAPARRAAAPDPEARLAELARSRGALRRVLAALAAALVARRPGGGWERLGYVRAGDYARERLGVSGRSLHDLARVGRALDGLPRLEAALASGELPWSHVRLLARFVGPGDEARWVALARGLGARALERRVRRVDRGALGAGAAPPAAHDCDEDGASLEPGETARLRVGAALAFKWRRTRTWAARVAGERVSAGTALEMITAETLSALPTPWAAAVGDPTAPPPEPRRAANVCAQHEGTDEAEDVCARHLNADEAANVCARHEDEAANVCARHLNADEAANVCARHEDAAPPAATPPARATLPAFLLPLLAGLDQADAFALDARLRRALRLEQRLDAEIASLLRRVASSEHAWRGPHRTLAAFARECLGMSPRKARALLRLERVGDVCPELRAGFRDGSLSWVQAQTLAPLLVIDADGPWRRAWLRFARRVTVRRLDEAVGHALALRESGSPLWHECRDAPERAFELETQAAAHAKEERQTCARPTSLFEGIRLEVVGPRDVVRLFRATLCSLRLAIEAAEGRLPSEADAFEAMIDHALRSWDVRDPWLRGHARRSARRPSVFERDGWRCTVPGCTSQRNLHAHHVRFRSAGGSNDAGNLTTLCAAHHHRGVHAGVVRIGGQAPDALWFELGVREGRPPLARFRSGDRVA